MVDGEKKLKVVFEPGAFDDFNGTQEELDELIAEITRLAESGELLSLGVPIEELDSDSLPEDVSDWLGSEPAGLDQRNRKLN